MQVSDALLKQTVEVVKAASVEVMNRFRRSQTVWEKDAAASADGPIQNPVSEADLAANEILRTGLTAALPHAGWLSEETADDPVRLDRQMVWIVDPIDGTQEYINGIDEFAISVALSVHGEPRLAVLYNPARDELFQAMAGRGCRLNRKPVRARPRNKLEGSKLLASRTESERGEFRPFEDKFEVQVVGSTAYKLAMIAAGNGHAYFTRKPRNEWDIAAGVLLCREAGAIVTDLDGNAHRFNRPDPLCRGIVCAVRGVHSHVMEQIKKAGTLL